jgi:hypothetical protein
MQSDPKGAFGFAPENLLVFDLEANGLLDQATLIHTCAYAYGTHNTPRATSPSDFAALLMQAGSIAGHNIIRYDLPLLHKLGYIPAYYINRDVLYWPDGSSCRVLDTLLVSRLTHGGRLFSHGLDAWGQRLGHQKLAVSDWHSLAQAVYDARCIQDVVITQELIVYLSPYMRGLGKALAIESHFADIIQKQVDAGVPFDSELAQATVDSIAARMAVLTGGVIAFLPECATTKGVHDKARIPTKRFNPDGSINGMFKNWLAHRELTLDGANIIDSAGNVMACIDTDTHLKVSRQLELSNDAGMKDWLISKGWEPEYWNNKKVDGQWLKNADGTKVNTSPTLKDKNGNICPNILGLMSASDAISSVVKAYLAYSVYDSRRATLKSMLRQPRLAVDGRLGADMTTLGASTGRVTHILVTNIPKSLNDFDTDHLAGAKNAMRACFKAPGGFVLVGVDYSALEARMEAHAVMPYLGGSAYAKLLLGEKPHDLHTLNAGLLGVSRDLAKRVKYLLSYGGGVALLQSVLRCSKERAADIYEQYWVTAACVKLYAADLLKEYRANKQLYIHNIDGSRLYVDAKYKLVNTALQGGGSKVVKTGALLIDNQLRKQGLAGDVIKLIDYHDEYQFAVRATDGLPDYFGKLALACVAQSGIVHNLAVPLTGEYLIGPNWGATH